MNLKNYGFVKVGRWKLNENIKSGIDFELNDLEEERVVYAFVVDGKVKYIGICEKKTLKDRMNDYKLLRGGDADNRIAEKIKNHLKNEITVEIFALKPKSGLIRQYKGLDVDLVGGLKRPLIEELDPEWNRRT